MNLLSIVFYIEMFVTDSFLYKKKKKIFAIENIP